MGFNLANVYIVKFIYKSKIKAKERKEREDYYCKQQFTCYISLQRQCR